MKFTDESIQGMLRGRRNVQVVPFPGVESEDGKTVGVRILLEEEMDQCRSAAVQYLHDRAKKLRLDPADLLDGDPEMLGREIKRQVISVAFVDTDTIGNPNGEEKFFPGIVQVRFLDTVMMETLWNVYLSHQQHVNPLLSFTSQADVESLVDELGKEPGAQAILSWYDAPSLRSLVLTLVDRRQTAQSGK